LKDKQTVKGLRSIGPFLIEGPNLALSGRRDGSFQKGDGLFFNGKKILDGFHLDIRLDGEEVLPGKGRRSSVKGPWAEIRLLFAGAGFSLIRQHFISPEADALLLEYHFLNEYPEERELEFDLEFSLDGLRGKTCYDEKTGSFILEDEESGAVVLKVPPRLADFAAEAEKARFRCRLYLSSFGQKVLHLFIGLGQSPEQADKACAFLAERHPEEIRKALGGSA
jgi:hypothetical protein